MESKKAMPSTKKMAGFRSVAEAFRSVADDPALADQIEEAVRNRSVINCLMAQRAVLNLSQKDIAEKMGCTQSRISKLESGFDDDLRLGDLREYTSALGLGLTMRLAKRDASVVDQVKSHVLTVRKLLLGLVRLTGEDKTIASGAQLFLREVLLNSVKSVVEANEKLKANLESASKNSLLNELPFESLPVLEIDDETLSDLCGAA